MSQVLLPRILGMGSLLTLRVYGVLSAPGEVSAQGMVNAMLGLVAVAFVPAVVVTCWARMGHAASLFAPSASRLNLRRP